MGESQRILTNNCLVDCGASDVVVQSAIKGSAEGDDVITFGK